MFQNRDCSGFLLLALYQKWPWIWQVRYRLYTPLFVQKLISPPFVEYVQLQALATCSLSSARKVNCGMWLRRLDVVCQLLYVWFSLFQDVTFYVFNCCNALIQPMNTFLKSFLQPNLLLHSHCSSVFSVLEISQRLIKFVHLL